MNTTSLQTSQEEYEALNSLKDPSSLVYDIQLYNELYNRITDRVRNQRLFNPEENEREIRNIVQRTLNVDISMDIFNDIPTDITSTTLSNNNIMDDDMLAFTSNTNTSFLSSLAQEENTVPPKLKTSYKMKLAIIDMMQFLVEANQFKSREQLLAFLEQFLYLLDSESIKELEKLKKESFPLQNAIYQKLFDQAVSSYVDSLIRQKNESKLSNGKISIQHFSYNDLFDIFQSIYASKKRSRQLFEEEEEEEEEQQQNNTTLTTTTRTTRTRNRTMNAAERYRERLKSVTVKERIKNLENLKRSRTQPPQEEQQPRNIVPRRQTRSRTKQEQQEPLYQALQLATYEYPEELYKVQYMTKEARKLETLNLTGSEELFKKFISSNVSEDDILRELNSEKKNILFANKEGILKELGPAILDVCARNNYQKCVKQLLSEKNLTIDDPNLDIFFVPVKNGYVEIVKLLLKDGRYNPYRYTTLLIAAQLGQMEIVQLLLADPRVNPTVPTNEELEADEELEEEMEERKREIMSIVKHTIHYYKFDIAQYIIRHFHLFNANTEALEEDEEDLLVDTIASVAENTVGYTQELDDLLFLILQDVDPVEADDLSIRTAATYGFVKSVKRLLQYERVNPAVYNNLPIQRAAEFGHLEVVKLLLADSRVDPAAEDEEGYLNSALVGAVKNNHLEVVRVLLQDSRVNPSNTQNIQSNNISEDSDSEDNKFKYESSRNVLYQARINENIEMFKLLFNNERIDLSEGQNLILREVLYLDKDIDFEIVRLLLSSPNSTLYLDNETIDRMLSNVMYNIGKKYKLNEALKEKNHQMLILYLRNPQVRNFLKTPSNYLIRDNIIFYFQDLQKAKVHVDDDINKFIKELDSIKVNASDIYLTSNSSSKKNSNI